MPPSLLPAPIEQLVAWGQYMHWCHLQYQRVHPGARKAGHARRLGVVSHWLAAEFVVLEGWEALKLSSARISRLLAAYPEHKDLLRRCRNAVYHFQKEPIDPRIERVLSGTNEELRWAAALHFEFQGVLLSLSDQLRLAGADGRSIASGLAGAIGWFPRHPFSSKIKKLERLCKQAERLIDVEDTPPSKNAKKFIATARATLAEVDMYPVATSLSRWRDERPSSQAAE